MKARIIKDGDRVIITFTEIDSPEDFLERVAKVVCGYAENEVVPQEVTGLAPAAKEEKESCVTDFEAPFTGKTPEEILTTAKLKGFYFLCQTKIPEQYKKETQTLLYEYAKKKKVFDPPYEDVDRMKSYLQMAERILGSNIRASEILEALENGPFDDDKREALVIVCRTACEMLKIFFTR